MAEDVDIPKVGKLPKAVIIPLAVGIVAFVGWRFYQARNDTGEESTIDDGEFGAVDSSIPGVIGAVSPTNEYGSGAGSSDAGNDPTRFTNDAQWTAYVSDKLVASDRWSYTDIVVALGNYLGDKPTTTTQQDIIRAALAVGGQPPTGSHSIISGGNTAITIAPGNVHLQSATTTQVVLAFNPVAGAARYQAYRDGVGANVGSSNGSPITISGLQPNSSYKVAVAAVAGSGTVGPKSGWTTVKTKTASLGKPATPTLSGIGKNSVNVRTSTVANADGYRWYVNGVAHGSSDGPSYVINGLKSKTKYTITVSADLARQNPGPRSAGKPFTTR